MQRACTKKIEARLQAWTKKKGSTDSLFRGSIEVGRGSVGPAGLFLSALEAAARESRVQSTFAHVLETSLQYDFKDKPVNAIHILSDININRRALRNLRGAQKKKKKKRAPRSAYL